MQFVIDMNIDWSRLNMSFVQDPLTSFACIKQIPSDDDDGI